MTESLNQNLTDSQVKALAQLLQTGSHHASEMLAKWIGKPSVVEIHSLEQLPLDEAADVLGNDDQPMCFCIAEVIGTITGEMILAFDDASGMAFVDLLLEQTPGTTDQWTEMAVSAMNETTNILCCAYLNALAESFISEIDTTELIPTPTKFVRDFAPSLLQFALMGQAISREDIILARTSLGFDNETSNWTLLFVPDAPSMKRLAMTLGNSATRSEDAD